MINRVQIETTRKRELDSHNRKMRVFDALLALIPDGQELMPAEIEAAIFDVRTFAESPEKPRTSRVPSLVDDAVRAYAEQATGEYTSATVRDFLLQSNNALLPTNLITLMNAIGVALQGLVTENYITRTYQGKGRDPHRYETNRVLHREGEAA